MRRFLPAIIVAWVLACASSESGIGGGTDVGAGGGGGTGAGPAPGGGGTDGLPPEQELEETFREPVVSGRWVWAANPDSGKVALIDTRSIKITTGEAELMPTYLAPLPSPDAEVAAGLVINAGSNTVSVLRGEAGVITSQSVPIHAGANALAVAPSGKVAVVWTDALRQSLPDATEGFQDVTVVAWSGEGATPKSRRLTVGYRPSRVFFDQASQRAFVVAESTISVIELTGETAPRVLRDVVLGEPSSAANVRDVSVTPDGKLALVRREGERSIELVDLVGGEKKRVSLPGPATDLDLSPDATRAYAVVRTPAGNDASGGGGEGGVAGDDDVGQGGSASAAGGEGGDGSSGPATSLLVVLALPAIWEDPSALEVVDTGDRVGSVALPEKGDVAVLYTNAQPSDHLVIVSTKGAPSEWALRTVVTKAPVKAVFVTPDGEHAIAFLGQLEGSRLPGGYAMVPLSERLPPKIVPTEAPPVGIALAPSPTQSVLVTVSRGDEGHAAHVIRLPGLGHDAVSLPGPPLAAGIVPATQKGFVAQRHPEGRITFVDLETGRPRTVTGFELSDKVDYVSK